MHFTKIQFHNSKKHLPVPKELLPLKSISQAIILNTRHAVTGELRPGIKILPGRSLRGHFRINSDNRRDGVRYARRKPLVRNNFPRSLQKEGERVKIKKKQKRKNYRSSTLLIPCNVQSYATPSQDTPPSRHTSVKISNGRGVKNNKKGKKIARIKNRDR